MRSKKFSSSPKCSGWLWGPHRQVFKEFWDSFLKVKLSVRELHHLSPSSAEVKNEWIYAAIPSTCLHA